MLAPKLKPGDEIRVIAPSHSIPPAFTDRQRQQALDCLKSLGVSVSFGKYVNEVNEFETTTVLNRLIDLHEAFADPNVKGVLTATGGSSVSQLLNEIDYALVKENPKIVCGLSDITALSYALYQKTGIVNYYGPHFTMLGESTLVDYSIEYMQRVLMEEGPVEIKPSNYYNDMPDDIEKVLNTGFWTLNEGTAEGKCIGGNFLTTNFIIGSEYMPDLSDCILYFEENYIMDYKDIQNELQSLFNHENMVTIKGLLLGRFQKGSNVDREKLMHMVKNIRGLESIPVIGNVDFGHTAPKLTLPIGGRLSLNAEKNDKVSILIIEH
ncbi:S66 peptidase family protein [Litoribacter populi]|uniref:S66 peptidase family protein n=1 Tax=Litoribacter populi TaxID=2598460 RepID=UPI00117D0A78|nr:S66 peptidase family protein [Litoribacter populi]